MAQQNTRWMSCKLYGGEALSPSHHWSEMTINQGKELSRVLGTCEDPIGEVFKLTLGGFGSITHFECIDYVPLFDINVITLTSKSKNHDYVLLARPMVMAKFLAYRNADEGREMLTLTATVRGTPRSLAYSYNAVKKNDLGRVGKENQGAIQRLM